MWRNMNSCDPFRLLAERYGQKIADYEVKDSTRSTARIPMFADKAVNFADLK